MKIVFLGTSITKGSPYGGVTATDTFAYKIGIANGYAPADILNKGVSSDTSAGMLSRLSADVLAHSPDVCVLEVGPNDQLIGVAFSTFSANVASIISQLQAANIKVVLLNSSMRRGSSAEFAAYKPYLMAMEKEAADAGCAIVDLYRELATSYFYLGSTLFAALYADMIHLTKAGHQFATDLAGRPKYAGVFVP